MSTFKDEAVRLMGLGLACFPLKHKSKHPATMHGVKDATTNPAKFDRWDGLAVACGAPSCVVVLDIDPRNGGNEGLEALVIRHGPLPATWECLTGGGGRHLYFRGVGRTHKVIGGGAVDLRGTGSYVVAPPSIHPDTGRAYVWELSAVPGEVPIADAPAWMLEAEAQNAPAQPLGAATPERLAVATLRFLQFGASEGERNNKLFAAACDMAGCGFSFAAASADLERAAAKCGLPALEARKTIESAWAAPRSPAAPGPIVIPNHLQIEPPEVVERVDPKIAESLNVPERAAVKPSTPANRPRLSNVDDGMREVRGKNVPLSIYKPIDRIGAELLEIADGWPKSACGILFVEQATPKGPEPRWLSSQDDFFAWVHETCGVRWRGTSEKSPTLCAATGKIMHPPTKGEFFSHLQLGNTCERYLSIARLPHEPRIPGLYYLNVELPEPTGAHLEEFLAAFNPETETDRDLILALLLTMGWGGPPGTRPLFVLASSHGMGAGKTATARAIGDVWGGIVELDPDLEWPEQCKRIMSSEDRDARAFLFDNIQGRFGGRSIEAAITAKRISGWRSYVGAVSRPNDATNIATINGPELSQDLAQRAVIIHIGAPKHGRDFYGWSRDYIAKHQLNIVSDLLALHRQPAKPLSGVVSADRFQAWTWDNVGRVGDPVAAAAMITERRPAADADAEDREAWQAMVGNLCGGHAETETTAVDVYRAAVAAKLWQPAKDRSESTDRQACLRRGERLLAGTGAISALHGEGGKVRRLDSTGTQRSQVYAIRANPVQDNDVPVI